MSEFILFGLAGIGAFCVAGLVVMITVLISIERRDKKIAKMIEELRMNDLSPSDRLHGKEKWPDFYSAAVEARNRSLQQVSSP